MSGNIASSSQPPQKRRRFSDTRDGSFITQIQELQNSAQPNPAAGSAMLLAGVPEDTQLVYRQQLRRTMDIDPEYVTRLSNRGEVGYWRTHDQKVLTNRIVTLNCTELRRNMTSVLQNALYVAYCDVASMRHNTIVVELAALVPVIVDMCMTALYAKLRTIHRSHGIHPGRYATAPSYSKEIELPLPLALAIQEIGVFETHSLTENYLYIPTYPEGTTYEGRANAAYPATTYLSYVPTLREIKIPLKSIDHHLKTGTPWWTFKPRVRHGTVDLQCTMPPSHYTDFSAQLRMLFLAPNEGEDDFNVTEIITQPDAEANYGVRAKELRRGIHIRAFLALSHCPTEWWTFV